MDAADITPDRLGEILGAPVTAVEPELIGNFSNQLWRLRLSYDGKPAGVPDALVLKQLRPDRGGDQRRGLGDEIRFYQELAPGLPVRTPRLYSASHDPPLLLMEEVRGFRQLNWRRGASEGHVELALTDLARFHAHYWGRVADAGWIRSYADPGFRKVLGETYDANWAERRTGFAAEAPHFVEIGDALVGCVPATLAALGAPTTLLHGDAHFENLALIEPDGGRPGILFHDWAGVVRGNASFDLATFAVMSFPVELRRRLEHSLVEKHTEGLRAAGVEVPYDPWQQYRRGVLAWSVRLVEFISAFSNPDDVTQGARRMVLERCSTAPVDLETGDLIA